MPDEADRGAPSVPAAGRKPLVVVGDGEFAQIAYEYFTHDSPYEVLGFAVEQAFLKRTDLFDLPVMAIEEMIERFPPSSVEVHVAVTYTKLNAVRQRLIDAMRQHGYSFANYVSSRAFVWRTVSLGDNVFVFENNVVQHGCVIGSGVVLWSGNHIGHRTTIGDGSYVSSHVVISGYCVIGRRCFIGVNSTFADRVRIGDDCFVAMASQVTQSIEGDDAVIKGAPARRSERLSAKRLMR